MSPICNVIQQYLHKLYNEIMIPMYSDINGCMVSYLLCMNFHKATEFYFSPQSSSKWYIHLLCVLSCWGNLHGDYVWMLSWRWPLWWTFVSSCHGIKYIRLLNIQTKVRSIVYFPVSKVHGANMGPTWVLSAPEGPHVGPMNFAIRVLSLMICHVTSEYITCNFR